MSSVTLDATAATGFGPDPVDGEAWVVYLHQGDDLCRLRRSFTEEQARFWATLINACEGVVAHAEPVRARPACLSVAGER